MPAQAPQPVDAELKNASVLHERADYANSIPAFERVLKQSPRSYPANLLLGEDLLSSGRFKEAVRPLQTAAELRPEDGVAEVYLAHAWTGLDDYARASGALLTALKRSGASAPFLEAWAAFCLDRVQTIGPHLRNTKAGEAVALRIEAALRPEGTAEREKLLEQSATEDPKQRGIWGELGTAQLELGQRPRALESLKNAQQSEPNGNGTLQLEGLLAATAFDAARTEASLTALAARSPAEFRNASGVWLHILARRQPSSAAGWACLNDPAHACPAELAHPQGGDGLGARKLYAQGRWEQLAALPPAATASDSDDLWHGVAYAQLGGCLNAIPLLEHGMKADEAAAGFWLDICYANQGNAALARLRSSGDKVAVEQLEGDIQLHLHDDPAAAETHFAEALKLAPNNAHLLERSAEAQLRAGNIDAAQSSALKAIALDAHNSYAIKTLATIAIQQRDYQQALTRLRELAQLEPQDPWTRVELGVSYAQLGDAAKALPYLEQELAAGYPDSKGGLHAQLAAVLRKLGKDDQAKLATAEAQRLANLSFQGTAQEPQHVP